VSDEPAKSATLIITCDPDGEPRTVSLTRVTTREIWAVARSWRLGSGYQRIELEWPETPEARKQALVDAHRSFRSRVPLPESRTTGREYPDGPLAPVPGVRAPDPYRGETFPDTGNAACYWPIESTGGEGAP